MMRLVSAAVLLAIASVPSNAGAAHSGKGARAHHQPSVSNAPQVSAKAPAKMTNQERALDRALNGICRGC